MIEKIIKKIKTKLKSQNGFTMQDIIGACIMITLFVSTIATLMTYVYKTNMETSLTSRMTIYAVEILEDIDKISYELVCILAFFLLGIVLVVVNAITSAKLNIVSLSLSMISYFVGYAILATLVTTTIKRLKAKTLFRELWIAKIYRWIKRNMENI